MLHTYVTSVVPAHRVEVREGSTHPAEGGRVGRRGREQNQRSVWRDAASEWAPRVARATLVRVGLQELAVGIRPFPARIRPSIPHTREYVSQTLAPPSTPPIRYVPM